MTATPRSLDRDRRDVLVLPEPAEVEPSGLFGDRLSRCREHVLLAKHEDELLAGFERRPGSHLWIGEHAGKWLDAACTEHERTRDLRLASKLGRVAARLRAAQESDGYLGTYAADARWTEWDVWVHKYVLIGLLAHARTFSDERSLDAARRAGELLLRTFHGGPLDLLSPRVSTHAGMAAASLLVALVPLHRATGDERFLDFARSIARRMEEDDGPRIVTGLRAGRGVHEIANGKAYEMLSCLCGLVDLARATGEAAFADAAKLAFDDVVRHQLYVTGGLSFEEFFRAPGTAPSCGEVSETCALVTWMQLCAELFRLTGERRFLAPFERAAWNHLLAAQRPDGEFGYFTPLEGPRAGRPGLHCCGSSGPRGLSLVPQLVFAVRHGGPLPRIELHLWLDASARLAVQGGRVELDLATSAADPAAARAPSRASLAVRCDVPCELALHAPSWAARTLVRERGAAAAAAPPIELAADHAWTFLLAPGPPRTFELEAVEPVTRLERGHGRESGRAARLAGPIVLARAEGSRDAPFVPFASPSPDDAPLCVWHELHELER